MKALSVYRDYSAGGGGGGAGEVNIILTWPLF